MNLNTGASYTVWGASMEDIRIEVLFCIKECEFHINILEFKVALFGLQTLCKNVDSFHILRLVYNT